MSVKGKLIKKVATKIKNYKVKISNSTDNMSSKGPIDKAIKKVKNIRDNYKNEHTLRYDDYADKYDKPLGMAKKHFYPEASDIKKGVTKANKIINHLKLRKLKK